MKSNQTTLRELMGANDLLFNQSGMLVCSVGAIEKVREKELKSLIEALEGRKEDDSFAQEIEDNYLINYKLGLNKGLQFAIDLIKERI